MPNVLCFLDMDGVLADFVDGTNKAHGRQSPYDDPKNFGIFEMEKCWDISIEDFWKPLEFGGFWLGLKKMEDADYIVDTTIKSFGVDNICILTSPSDSPYCIPEKKEWIAKYYPQFKKNMLFGSAKRFLAGPNRVLVDDRDKNIEDFIAAGGHAITVPRLWNKYWPEVMVPNRT